MSIWRVIALSLVGFAVACSTGSEGGGDRFHEGGIAFDRPPGWSLHDAKASFSGGSVLAVLGTQPVDPRCGAEHIDINCYYERKLEPGTISVIVGTGSFRGRTMFDEPELGDLEIGRHRTEIGGLPAIVYRYGPGGYYQQDEGMAWQIAFPRSVLNVFGIEARLRGPGLDTMRAELWRMVASLSFDGLGPALSAGPGKADAVVGLALGDLDRTMRRGWVSRPEHVSWYACFPPVANVATRRTITLGPEGPLADPQEVECRFTVATEGSHLWRVRLELNGGRYVETVWLTGDGTVAGRRASGTPPS